jgi:hypothetical protein
MESAFVRNAKLMVIVIASTVGLASCDVLTSPVEVHVRTDAAQYPPSGALGHQSTVVTATLVNNDTKSVFLLLCGAFIQKRVGGVWVTAWQRDCSGVNGVNMEVKPEQSVPLSFELNEASADSFNPAFPFDVCNVHRVAVALSDHEQYAPNEKIVVVGSNSFGFGGLCS